jgi:menaquinone-dependent protoporphyrinogen oxidase
MVIGLQEEQKPSETGVCMKVLVVYASRYGSTKGIAEFIAETLRKRGIEVETHNATSVSSLEKYDAFVIGSAVYMGRWMDEAAAFLRKNRASLAGRPVWLFSSGPLKLGPEFTSAQDPKLEPKEISEFRTLIQPRDHHIFFGALDPQKLGLAHRMLRKLPAARAILPEGDFRDWNDIEAWTIHIAEALTTSPSQ